MPSRNTYTRNSGNYTGAAGATSGRIRIATWQIQHPRGVIVAPQPPGMKDLVIFIQSTVPAHIATGTIEVIAEDSNHQLQMPVMVIDASQIGTTLAIQQNQDTAVTYQRPVKLNFGDYLSIYFTTTTASVDANCTYQMPVLEL